MRHNLIYIILVLLSCQQKNEDDSSIITQDSLKNNINSEIYDSLQHIINSPVMYISDIGFTELTKSYETFLNLKKIVTREEIQLLLQHHDPKVRSYSFWALRDNKYAILPALFTMVNDTAILEMSFGCMSKKETVGEFCYWKIWEKNMYKNIDTCYLTRKQIDSLDSYLLKSNINKELIENLLLQKTISEQNYTLIKERVINNINSSYSVALARFQKTEDKQFIESLLTNTTVDYSYKYKMIEVFPHKDFHVKLVAIADSLMKINKINYDIIGLYRANAKYRGTVSIPLFNKVLRCISEGHDRISSEKYLSENNQQRAFIVGVLEKTDDILLKKYKKQLEASMIADGFDSMLDFYINEEDY